MSPEKQREAIAEATGYIRIAPEVDVWRHPQECHGLDFGLKGLPDVLHDLNMMHAAETWLTPVQTEAYAEKLCDVIEIPAAFTLTARGVYLMVHATAPQRAEAFLRTIGKWEDPT